MKKRGYFEYEFMYIINKLICIQEKGDFPNRSDRRAERKPGNVYEAVIRLPLLKPSLGRMKALCAAGKSQELNCCTSAESTPCCKDKFLPAVDPAKQSEMKSVFAGPSFSVDIEFKDLCYSVKIKGRGEINIDCLSFYFSFIIVHLVVMKVSYLSFSSSFVVTCTCCYGFDQAGNE